MESGLLIILFTMPLYLLLLIGAMALLLVAFIVVVVIMARNDAKELERDLEEAEHIGDKCF